MMIVAILNAGRNSFSFFLLLIVCMGYGVVKPSLGKTMIYVRYLAGAHFVFGLVYAIGSLTISPENAGEMFQLIKRGVANSNRPTRTLRHSSTRRNSHSILCLDSQLLKCNYEGPQGAQTVRKGVDVQKALVVHPRIHCCYLRFFLLQLFHIRVNRRSRFRAFPLANSLVCPWWVA